ncbi:VCBS repeat-containing protein [Croceitalea sp. MTPC9]|uniref:FG-GAP repeat domain-containing protein n=1 Tax=unclassified Croceitalea TaxID=2632280 RepID=UPI002B3769D0|nr:VCBS repeat-containing protein [Croceitalea sp. MTPC6]GMN16848.1 VCBS repeat-containing protein [Croceitalea sp. MTPC9]
MTKNIVFSVFVVVSMIVGVLFLDKIKKPKSDFGYQEVFPNPKEQRTGLDLAKIYCSSCHKFPEPKELDKETWETTVLPNMAFRLGLKVEGKNWYDGIDPSELPAIKKMNVYPEKPVIKKDEWNLIRDYYLENAPQELAVIQRDETIKTNEFPFALQSIEIGKSTLPHVTLLEYDEANSKLYIGDYLNFYAIDAVGNITENMKLESPASDIDFTIKDNPFLLTIGKIEPSDQYLGSLGPLDKSNKGKTISQLKRPVNFEIEDFNNDGQLDALVCNFGHNQGTLSLYNDFKKEEENILSYLPGTRKAKAKDLNNDGRIDIVALMTQAREQIMIYYNQGDGKFDEKIVLKFSPVNGTSYFELHDFNEDGYQDLMVTNGDNRDFSAIEKPYHGVRIYLNDGADNFEESFFFPMYDCGKAMAEDFDKDGDLDIVAASFFAKYSENRKAEESLIYLENIGNMNFKPAFINNSIHGNWLTMEVADFNLDGKKDVMLGTFIYDINEMMSITNSTGNFSFPQVLLLTQL